MNDLNTVAVAKVVKKGDLENARNELLPGEYAVNQVLHLTGTLKVGEDEQRTPTTSIPILDAMALLVHDSGVTGKAALKAIKNAMQRALNQDLSAKAAITAMRGNLETAERQIRATLQELPKVPAKGKVTTKLVIQEWRQA